jgi:tRNA nucleotidyltransferase (CCA-adding enzyme)
MEIAAAELAPRLRALALEPLVELAGKTPIFLVGGAVRDLLLGRERTDIDVAVEGDAAELARRLGGEVLEHERFGTAIATVGPLRVDLARTRAESYPSPGALPDVRPASLADDLARRDFTINAMAVPLQGELELIDPHDGARDLQAGLLRVLHSRSFGDDPTRALRAARYGARFGFDLEPETESLIRAVDLSAPSRDRIDAEMMRLAGEPQAARAFELLEEWGVLRLDAGSDELIEAASRLLQERPWSELADRALIIHAAALGHAPGEAGRLRDLRAQSRGLAARNPGRPSEAVALANGHSGVELLLARAMGAAWIEDYVERWRKVELEIAGADLLAAGIDEGPGIGRGLDVALRRKLDGEIAGRDQELRAALDAARAEDR